MAFLEGVKQLPAMTEQDKKAAVDKEIAKLIKARGFEPGTYRFEPNPNVQREDGSIINGCVKGKFGVEDGNIIVFKRCQFSDKMWKRICSIMGFKYHAETDIDQFTIMPNIIEVDVSIVTPLEDF